MGVKHIVIDIIPHDQQRYETPGDYWLSDDGDTMHVKISELGSEIEEVAVAVHEIVEFALLRHKGKVTEQQVTYFDCDFEERRKKGEFTEYDEPGFAADSPYQNEHLASTSIEMAILANAGVNWAEYEQKFIKLLNGK